MALLEIWRMSSVDSIVSMACLDQCLSYESKPVSLFVHIRPTALHCACAVTFLLVTVACSVPRDVHASMTPRGQPM